MWRLISFLCALISLSLFAKEPVGYWDQNVWAAPDRPFLYYGIEKEKMKDKTEKTDEAPPASVKEWRALAQAKLEAAIVEPTDDNIVAYLRVNQAMLSMSDRFSQAWRRTLWAHPELDWTAAHPSVNTATSALSMIKTRAQHELMARLKDKVGFLVILDKGPLSELMAPILNHFKKTHGWELLCVSPDGVRPASLGPCRHDPKVLSRFSITMTPAVLLVPNPASPPPAWPEGRPYRLLATGVVSLSELERRIDLIFRKGENK